MGNKKTYVLNLTSEKWTTFSGLDVISNSILSGGQRIDNVNLFLDTTGHTKVYPDDDGARTSEVALIKKEIKFYYITLRDITADYIDKLAIGTTATIDITVKNSVRDFDKANSITITSDDNVMKRYGLPLGNYGDKIELILTGFDKIRNVMLTLNNHRTRR